MLAGVRREGGERERERERRRRWRRGGGGKILDILCDFYDQWPLRN